MSDPTDLCWELDVDTLDTSWTGTLSEGWPV